MNEILQLKELLGKSDNTVVLTGAGISKSAGIPTFRGAGGLWRDAKQVGFGYYDSFVNDTEGWYGQFWNFYDKTNSTEPTIAHKAIWQLVNKDRISSVVTQNVDGLDLKAGNNPEKLFEIHGNLRSLQCQQNHDYSINLNNWRFNNPKQLVPKCEIDQSPLKPCILLFKEAYEPNMKWLESLQQEAAQKIAQAELLITIGTTFDIGYVADWVYGFGMSDRPIVVINPERTIMDNLATLAIQSTADEVFNQLTKNLTK